MTLILALVAKHKYFMTCDFKLTDGRTGAILSVDAHKMVPSAPTQAHVAMTGIAHLDQQPIADWVLDRLRTLDFETVQIDDVFAVLRQASGPLGKIEPRFRRLTFVIGFAQGTQTGIAMLSNFETLAGDFLPSGEDPGTDLRLSVDRPSRARLVMAGEKYSLRRDERKQLERTLQSGSSAEKVIEALVAANRRVASRVGTVTEGCLVERHSVDGTGYTSMHLVEQPNSTVPAGSIFPILQSLGLKPSGPNPPQIVHMQSVFQEGNPEWFKGQLKLKPDNAQLWNSYGAALIGRGAMRKGMSAYERALAIEPGFHLAARNLGQCMWQLDGDDEEVRRLHQLALTSPDPSFVRHTYCFMGLKTARIEGDPEEAERLFQLAMDGDFMPLVGRHYADFLFNYVPGRARDAEHVYDQVIDREPSDAMALLRKSFCLSLIHTRTNAGLEMVEAALRRAPEDPALLEAKLLHLHDQGSVSPADWQGLKDRKAKALWMFLTGGDLVAVRRRLDEPADANDRVNLGAVHLAAGDAELSRSLLTQADTKAMGLDARAERDILMALAHDTSAPAFNEAPWTHLDRRLVVSAATGVATHPATPPDIARRAAECIETLNRQTGRSSEDSSPLA